MSKQNGFVPLRRGLWEHVRDGRMTQLEALAFIYICSQADTRTGIWRGSAGSLVSELGLRPRTARDVLERMEHGDYIRRAAIPGRHLCYPILVHKFPITQGEHDGEQVDALSSIITRDCIEPRYFPREHDGEPDGKPSASQRRSDNREKRKTLAAKPAPADPRFPPFLKFAFDAFEQKHGQKPTWTGRDFKALSAMLASNRGLESAELERRFRNYLGSTEPFTQNKGGSLAYFCGNTDSFLAGPIMAFQRKGTNGKPSTSDNIETTLATLRAVEQVRPN